MLQQQLILDVNEPFKDCLNEQQSFTKYFKCKYLNDLEN